MSLQLLKVPGERLPEVAALAHKIWQVHYPSIVGQGQVDYMLKKFYDGEALKKQQAEGQDFYLIEKDNKSIGFISISQKDAEHCFIHKFYIDAAEQGNGLGESVFGLVKVLIGNTNPVIFSLTVNRQNHRAINFYFKIGFKIKEVADFDIGEGFVMNDFVMEWKGL